MSLTDIAGERMRHRMLKASLLFPSRFPWFPYRVFTHIASIEVAFLACRFLFLETLKQITHLFFSKYRSDST